MRRRALAAAVAGTLPAGMTHVPIIGAPKRPTEYPQLDQFGAERHQVEGVPGAAVYRLMFGCQLQADTAKGRMFELRLLDHAPLSVIVRELRAMVDSMEATLAEFPPAEPESPADAKADPKAADPAAAPVGAERQEGPGEPDHSPGLIARA